MASNVGRPTDFSLNPAAPYGQDRTSVSSRGRIALAGRLLKHVSWFEQRRIQDCLLLLHRPKQVEIIPVTGPGARIIERHRQLIEEGLYSSALDLEAVTRRIKIAADYRFSIGDDAIRHLGLLEVPGAELLVTYLPDSILIEPVVILEDRKQDGAALLAEILHEDADETPTAELFSVVETSPEKKPT